MTSSTNVSFVLEPDVLTAAWEAVRATAKALNMVHAVSSAADDYRRLNVQLKTIYRQLIESDRLSDEEEMLQNAIEALWRAAEKNALTRVLS